MISAAAPHQDERLNPPAASSITLSGLAPAGKAIPPVVNTNPNKKKVLFVTSELADLVKTGGLGDVSAA
ncbi:glycogen/starch synthase, partial [Pseudomonas helleri]